MKEFYYKWYSQYLSRDFEMLVFGETGMPIILFPTSHGRYYENKDKGLIQSVEKYIDEGSVKIFCPDGIDGESWENYDIEPRDRVQKHLAYERLIINDVIGFAKHDTKYQKVFVSGCSFGGYHSANIAFKYPDRVSGLISMSGTFDIKPFIWGYYDDDCYFNCPIDYLPGLTDPWYIERIKKMKIILGTGTNDMCLDENINISNILHQKNIPHVLDVGNGIGHDWNWWKEMFPRYIKMII